MSEIQVRVEGMTCATCVGRVERALLKVPGVDQASVNLATDAAWVQGEASLESIEEAIRKAGYTPKPINEKAPETPDWREFAPLWLAIALTFPLVLPMLVQPLDWAGLTDGHWHHRLQDVLSPWIQFLLATPVQFVIGARFYIAAWKALRSGDSNMDVLVVMGTTAAYGLSLWLWWDAVRSGLDAPDMLYFEASAAVITLVLLGKWLESRARAKTSEALRALQNLQPERARVRRQGKDLDLPIEQLQTGDTVVLRPGERCPVDGVIIEGRSHMDESMLTGESLPISKGTGDPVIGGAINGEGGLLVEATAIGKESTLAGIVRLVETAQAKKAPIQKTVDQVTRVFVPIVALVAVITWIGWSLYGLESSEVWLRAISVLVIACPCALGLATPAAMMAGTGRAAREGIIIRDAEALELAHGIQTVAFDKTGTLTQGNPQRTGWLSDPALDAMALDATSALQTHSEHPLARATLALHAPPADGATDVQALPGNGIEGTWRGHRWFLGHGQWMQELGALNPSQPGALETKLSQQAADWAAEGRTLSWLAMQSVEDGQGAGAIQAVALMAFEDPLKAEAAEAVRDLEKLGIECALLSGDHAGAVNKVAKELGIPLDRAKAQLKPAGKAAWLQSRKASEAGAAAPSGSRVVAMVGDGINDAPALAAADVGMAIAHPGGKGSDVSMATAGITLLRGDPRLVARAIEVSRRTSSKIKQNLFWAFIYNVVGIPLAAFGLLDPVLAGAAMALSSVSVVTNALWLQRRSD